MSKNIIDLSIVVPFFNEEEVLPELHKRISTVVKKIGACFEIVYVNDGSTDATLAMVKSWAVKEETILDTYHKGIALAEINQ